MKRPLLAIAAVVLVAACSSKPVNLKEARRVLGTENDVRLDAEVYGDELSSSESIAIKFDVTNQRANAIAVADIVPDAAYDPETQTVTVSLGSEVPGNELLPRLVVIGPGQKKSFGVTARVVIMTASSARTPLTRYPKALRLKLNFLGDTTSFEPLLNITEKAVHDPQLADKLFPTWVERNEVIFTNALPMRWNPNKRVTPAEMRGE